MKYAWREVKGTTDDQVKILFAQVTQLLEGRSTVVELKDPMVHTDTRGRPPGSLNLSESSK